MCPFHQYGPTLSSSCPSISVCSVEAIETDKDKTVVDVSSMQLTVPVTIDNSKVEQVTMYLLQLSATKEILTVATTLLMQSMETIGFMQMT